MKFDLISDLHIDRWVDYFDENTNEKISTWIQSILPIEPAGLLIIAGDMGEYNKQNFIFLKELKKYYKKIAIVYGNNDLTVPREEKNYEKFVSVKEKMESFKKEIEILSNVQLLDGETLIHQGVNFGGCEFFFDFDHLKKKFGISQEKIDELWKYRRMDTKHKGWMDNVQEYLNEQKRKLGEIVESCDVIVTHGPPDFTWNEEDKALGFFRFDGEPYKNKIENKIWCFGHSHKRSDTEMFGCRMINASVGYQKENPEGVTWKKVIQIEYEK